MHKRYNAEIVAGALLPAESRVIARLLLNHVSDDEFDHLIKVDNVLQKRSPGTAVRKAELIRKRLDTVEDELLRIVADGSRQASNQALLIAAIKHSSLIGDFVLRVVKEKWRIFERKLKPTDWEAFLQECAQIDPNVKNWRPSTREKLGQVVRKCLVEAEFLEGARNQVITPVIIVPEIKRYLLDHNDKYVLGCIDIFS